MGYLPLEHQDPPARRAARLAAAGARLLVADAELRADLDGVTFLGPPALAPGDGVAGEAPTATPGDLAYLMFTSGSTGGAKGVMIPHSGIANYVRWLRSREWLRPGERIVLKTPYTFDVSVSEIFWPLATGATLVVAPEGLHHDPVASPRG